MLAGARSESAQSKVNLAFAIGHALEPTRIAAVKHAGFRDRSDAFAVLVPSERETWYTEWYSRQPFPLGASQTLPREPTPVSRTSLLANSVPRHFHRKARSVLSNDCFPGVVPCLFFPGPSPAVPPAFSRALFCERCFAAWPGSRIASWHIARRGEQDAMDCGRWPPRCPGTRYRESRCSPHQIERSGDRH